MLSPMKCSFTRKCDFRWSPQNEQNKFSALASMGGTFGTIFIYPAVGLVLEAYNWQARTVQDWLKVSHVD